MLVLYINCINGRNPFDNNSILVSRDDIRFDRIKDKLFDGVIGIPFLLLNLRAKD